jgi:hypothetical protein
MRPFSALLAAALLATTACATSQSGTGGTPSPASASRTVDRTRITAEEIEASKLATPYDVVDRLRRQWWRDPLTREEVSVYLDNQRLPNGREALRELPLVDVAELQYLTGEQAQARWGQEARGGAIIVVRKMR